MRYKATVSYDGSGYYGWQSQNDKPSVQQKLNEAISHITNETVSITGSGRTDSRVHAYGQTFHFDTDKKFADLASSINSQLPDDIHVIKVEEVSDDFHARYDVRWKHYDYLINNGPYDPLKRNYCVHEQEKLDTELMKKAGDVFLGEHDFTSFNATKKQEIANQTRTIYNISVASDGNMIRISFYGSGFLRYMVRMLAQTMIEAGKGKISPDEIREMLEKKDKEACHFNGQPQGLYLMEVGYQDYQ